MELSMSKPKLIEVQQNKVALEICTKLHENIFGHKRIIAGLHDLVGTTENDNTEMRGENQAVRYVLDPERSIKALSFTLHLFLPFLWLREPE